MAEKPSTRLKRLEKKDRELLKEQSKLREKQRGVEEKYRQDHQSFMDRDRELQEQIDSNDADLVEARREASIEEAEAAVDGSE